MNRPVRLCAVGCFGVLGMARRCARPHIVVDANIFDALGEFLRLVGGFLLRLDLGLALAVGGLCFLEDADNVLALGWWSVRGLSTIVPYRRLTLLTTLPDLLMTVMVSPTPIVAILGCSCSCTALRTEGMWCDQIPGCGVVLDVQVYEAVRNDQCFGNGTHAGRSTRST